MLLAAVSVPLMAQPVRMLQTVERNLNHARSCLDLLQFEEAQAYAQASAPPTTIRYSVTNDLTGVTERACRKWEEALEYKVRFEQTNEANADMKLRFVPKTGYYGHDAMGRAIVRRSVTQWKGGQFTLQLSGYLEVSQFWPDGRGASDEVMLNATLHEIGHFLGLDDTFQKGHVMAPIDSVNLALKPSSDESLALLVLKDEATALAEWAETQIGLSAKAPR